MSEPSSYSKDKFYKTIIMLVKRKVLELFMNLISPGYLLSMIHSSNRASKIYSMKN